MADAAHPLIAGDRVFVGREAEMDLLTRGMEDVLAGHGRIFLVTGEPGIGKTRLVSELCAVAEARGMRTVWGRCWEGGGAPPYWPLTQILRAYGRRTEPAAS